MGIMRFVHVREHFGRIAFFLCGFISSACCLADGLLFSYEGNELPSASNGWPVSNPCENPCSEFIENGAFVWFYPFPGDWAIYKHRMAEPPALPPPTLWIEWQFRSNHPIGPNFDSCDASFQFYYGRVLDSVFMYGNAAISGEGGDSVHGLSLDEFHTYRFESLDGMRYQVSVDGVIFVEYTDSQPLTSAPFIQFEAVGGCPSDWIPNMKDEWDMVRYGTIGFGERFVAADPPIGYLNPNVFSNVDRFTVTYDSPNYAYIDDITVETTCDAGQPCPEAPQVIATKRLDNGPSDVLQIILDRPLPLGERTTFTFTDVDPSNPANPTINTVSYTYQLGDINADGQWNLRDFAALQTCFFQLSAATDCAAFDFNDNIIIDLPDHAAFYSLMIP